MREYVLRSRPVMLEDCLGTETRAALEKVTTGRFIRSFLDDQEEWPESSPHVSWTHDFYPTHDSGDVLRVYQDDDKILRSFVKISSVTHNARKLILNLLNDHE